MEKVVTGIRVVVATILRKARAGMGAKPSIFQEQLLEELHARLKKSKIDKFKLNEAFLDQGINLPGLIGRSLSKDYPWSGRSECHQYMPDNAGVQTYLETTAEEDPVVVFERLDGLFQRSLAVSMGKDGAQADPTKAKAEIFAAVLSSSYSLPYLCVSSVMRDYAGAWLEVLAAGPDEHAMACTSLLYKRFHEITLQKPVDSLRTVVAEGVMHYGRLLSTHRIQTTGQTKFGSDWDTMKGAAKLVGLTRESCVSLSVLAHLGGNRRRFHATVDAVFEHPDEFAKTLTDCTLSNEEMLDTVGYCLASWVRAGLNADVSSAKTFVDAHRSELMKRGFQDIFGTKALDPLAMSLELGEGFSEKGYLRRENLNLNCRFATYYESTTGKGDEVPVEVIRRKVGLAIALGQNELLMQAADEMFSGHRPTNLDLSSPVAVMCLLEHGIFKPSDILRTELRVQKAIEWGLGKLICQDPALKKYTARAFTADLGV